MEEKEYLEQLAYLQLFVDLYTGSAYIGPKKSTATEESRMVAGFQFIMNELERTHNVIPFNYRSLEDEICEIMGRALRKKKREHDWLNPTIIECGDYLIAVLNGYEDQYDIFWDFEAREK